jgi:hypothetical protein
MSTTNLGDASTTLGTVGSVLLVAGACLLWVRTWDLRPTTVGRVLTGALAALATAVVYFDNGTRSLTALIIGPVLILVLLDAWRRSPVRAVAVGLALGAGLFAILQFQMLYRSDVTSTSIAEHFFSNALTFGGGSDFFRETLLAVRLVPSEHEFWHESVFVQFVTAPVPRFLWPDKPIPELVWFYSLHRWNVDIYTTGGNALPGIVGQYYMSWDWWGVLLCGAGFGAAGAAVDVPLGRLDPRRDAYRAGGWIMLLVWLFLSYRLLSPGFVYPVLAVGTLLWLCRDSAALPSPRWNRPDPVPLAGERRRTTPDPVISENLSP